jgi:hypothetical protein
MQKMQQNYKKNGCDTRKNGWSPDNLGKKTSEQADHGMAS